MPASHFTHKLTFHARHSLQESRSLALLDHSPEVGPKHLLLAILFENGSLGNNLLTSMGFDKDRLTQFCLQNTLAHQKKDTRNTLMPPNEALKKVIERAYGIASQFQSSYVGTEHLVYALLETDDEALDDIFIELEIDEKKIETTLATHMGFEKFPDLARLFDMQDPRGDFTLNKVRSTAENNTTTPTLAQYAIDLTHPKATPEHTLSGRTDEIIRLTQILARKQKSNPLLIGEPGVGKTALVSALAQKIKTGQVPRQLIGKRIYALDLALIVAGTNFRGEFEARFKEIIREATESKDVILFIDEIHTLVGAGNQSGGLDAANILKPALARGDIQCIGATTLSEFKRHIEKDAALERRFQTLRVEEPSQELTLTMLQNAKGAYETHHQIQIPNELLPVIVEQSVRYIADRFLPDKAFDVLDEAATLVEQKDKESQALRKRTLLEQELLEMNNIKTSLIQNNAYDEADKWHEKIIALEKKLSNLREIPERQLTDFPVMQRKHILETISRISGIPLHKLSTPRPKIRLAHLRRALSQEILGQKKALSTIDHIFARSLAQLEHTDRPVGSLLFLGPTGVGKTLTAKIIAREFFGDEKALIRLDMSEFMERHSVAQILGAPAGYVGYGEGGKLTEQVRRRPFSVILFDEIEKAHPDVFNLLLQILDEGRLTDAEGRVVNFRHCLIILTSNIGTQTFSQKNAFGFDEQGAASQMTNFTNQKNKVLADLKKELRPEIIARLDHVIVFEPMNEKILKNIVTLELKKLTNRLLKKGLHLTYTEAVTQHLLNQKENTNEGARLVRKNITAYIENLLATTLLDHPDATQFSFDIKANALVCQAKK